jgi:hypothetical protein
MPAVLIFGILIAVALLYAQSAQASSCGPSSGSSGSEDSEPGCAPQGGLSSGYGFNINNPGNIRWITNPQQRWQGMTQNDNGYAVFDTLSNGVRAIGKQLQVIYSRGATSITKIISVWAPASDNNKTQAYIQDVSTRLNVDPDEPLEPFQDLLPDLTAAIIIHENGHNTIDEGDLLTYLNS